EPAGRRERAIVSREKDRARGEAQDADRDQEDERVGRDPVADRVLRALGAARGGRGVGHAGGMLKRVGANPRAKNRARSVAQAREAASESSPPPRVRFHELSEAVTESPSSSTRAPLREPATASQCAPATANAFAGARRSARLSEGSP